ncbi:endothelin-converting enzyme homolog isoform X2 [Panonychus citri]|uniref:endothelin-converting enzyme homolog isoform X2 n=1 Tax=Panonychus citri TaxID=50023 RepID=UPI0023077B08|nr:endothelin-converting enzyme homolog isoform X2 [Panonychus citri]
MITAGQSTGSNIKLANGNETSSSSHPDNQANCQDIIVTTIQPTTSNLNQCNHETFQQLNKINVNQVYSSSSSVNEMKSCQPFNNPLASSVDHRSIKESSCSAPPFGHHHRNDNQLSDDRVNGQGGSSPQSKEEVVVNPGSGEVKTSFMMRHQIEALFQPTDNKLAIKLFGSKGKHNQNGDNNNNNNQQSQSVNNNLNQIASTTNKSTESNHHRHRCIFHLCNNFSLTTCLKVKKGERGYKTIIISLILIIIILISLQSYMIIITAKQSQIVSTIKNLCLTPGCIKAASSLLSRMDINVDPCHDFYSFACGSFVQMKTVPDSLVTYDMLQQMEEVSTLEMRKLLEANITDSDGIAISKAKIFYSSCIDDKSNSNESENVAALIDSIVHPTGPWPLLHSILNSPHLLPSPSLEDRILDTFIYQVQSIFRITILPEILPNATRNDLCISIGRTVIEDEYLVNPNRSAKYDEYKSFYKEYHVNMMERLSSLLTGTEIKLQPHHLSEIDEVIDFEMEFGKLTAQDYSESSSSSETNNSTTTIDPLRSTSPPSPRPLITVGELSSNFTAIQWIKIFAKLSTISGVNISDLCTEKEDYLVKLNELIPRYSPRTIDNYLCWAILAQYTESLGPSFRRLQGEFRRRVPEIRATEPNRIFFSRWKECVYITTRILPIPSSHLYLTHKPNHVSLANGQVNVMLNEIKEAMYSILDSQEWLNQPKGDQYNQMTNESQSNEFDVRLILKNRIADSTLLVGLPDYLLNRSQLDEQYKHLIVSSDQVFINNWLNLTKHEKILELTRIGLTVEKNLYFNPPTEANAFYDWNIKMITLPLGILHEPIISEGRPRFLDYSTLGHILGHEISHSLDKDPDTDNTTGINWWPNQLKSEYESRARCFAEQYSTYKIDLINEYVFCEVATPDGYLKNLLTDPHSPGKYRANGVLVNTPQFSRAFNCPLGSPMNPIDKCKLWSIEG